MKRPYETQRMKNLLFVTAGRLLGSRVRFAGVSHYAAQRGWSVQVIEHARADTDFKAILSFWKPIGAILEYGEELPREAIASFKDIPTVCLDRNPTWGGICICQDSRMVGKMIAQELSAVGTFASFGYVGFSEEKFWDDERRQGFLDALACVGRSCNVFDARKENGQSLERNLDKWLATLPRPCGIMASNDNMAAKVLGVCAQADISVPDEVAVIGVDNAAHVCESTTPTLSSVEPDFEGSGYLAAQTVARLYVGEPPANRVLRFGPIQLVRRASSAILRRHDPTVARALEFIRTNAASGLRVGDVLAIFGCSRRSAEMRFLKSSGVSIFTAINNARIEKAMMLLRDKRQAIEPIASLCGFGTEANFHRAFLQATDLTPGQWRRQMPSVTASWS